MLGRFHHFGLIAGMREHSDDCFVRWLSTFLLILRIGEFILGTLVAQFYCQLQMRKVTAVENAFGNLFFTIAAASVLVISYLSYGPGVGMNVFEKMDMNFALAPSAALLIFCAARYRSSVSWVLNTRAAIALGDASYSIYPFTSVCCWRSLGRSDRRCTALPSI